MAGSTICPSLQKADNMQISANRAHNWGLLENVALNQFELGQSHSFATDLQRRHVPKA